MWNRKDNQDVGSEAATIERVRNSSLVEWICAENSAGFKLGTEATDSMTGLPVVVWWGGVLSTVKVDREDGWSGRKCECRHE